jgi:hypothetical protein
VPIYFVAGFLLVEAYKMIRSGGVLRIGSALVTLALLIGLLFPISNTYINAPYSRFVTLKPVDPNTSPEQWQDLLDYLDTLPDKKYVITDPVTGYLISALTRHHSYRAKFHRAWGGYINFDLDDYSNHPFDHHAGKFLIINRRNGAMSETGRLGRHWPEMILQVDTYYKNDRLDEYIATQPARIEKLWDENRIQVYRILPAP